ncbi:MAG: hypothetical protein FRX48_07893 [Lasallia pustulata]|uniref:7alpha-cephem-methoxylase P8 chain n=1 Tax=Lasallia pustulata TaxID=136370 RepID=A0A5M8PFP9_9LECA|nr:MAG: hypothetical protein FRX48_07893 [Lasallia pustulata]
MATTTATQTSQSHSHINGTLKINGASAHDASYIPRGPVTTPLNFFQPPADGSTPFNYVEQPPEGQPQRNFSDIAIPVEISDIRGQEHKFTLDQNAFEALKDISSEEHEFADDSHIKKVYYPEVEKLILDNVPGAKRVLIFDHTIRRANPNASRAPVTRVHIDQTLASAEARVRHHLPDEADTLIKSRYRIINVWRPINGAVESFPLGFADSSSVRDEDIVGVEHRYPDRTGETAGVKHSDSQKWYYWSGMTNDERLLLKCSDSDEVVRQSGGRVPHTAFVHPRSPEGAKPRESIEVRALVFG